MQHKWTNEVSFQNTDMIYYKLQLWCLTAQNLIVSSVLECVLPQDQIV